MVFIKFRNIENNITRRAAKCLMRKKIENKHCWYIAHRYSIASNEFRKANLKISWMVGKREAEYPLYIWCPYHKLSWKITWWRKIEIWLNEPCLLLPSLVLYQTNHHPPTIQLYTIYGILAYLLHMYFSLMTFSFDIGSSLFENDVPSTVIWGKT